MSFLLCMILFSDIIKEVIEQQSTLYDNVNIVANFFKYEQVRLSNEMFIQYHDRVLLLSNSHPKAELLGPYMVMTTILRTQ